MGCTRTRIVKWVIFSAIVNKIPGPICHTLSYEKKIELNINTGLCSMWLSLFELPSFVWDSK